MIQAASGKADETIKLAIQMASIFASYATESGAVLPFFTLYDFETFAQSIRRVSGATLFAYTPYLANEDLRNQWEEHAKANQQWVPRGHAFLSSDFSATTSLAAHSSTHPEEFGTMPEKVWMEAEENNLPGVVDNHGPPYTPLWQMSPAPNTTERLNLNLYRQADEFVQQIEHVRKTRRYALSPPVPVRDWLGSALPRHDTSGNARHEEEEPPQSLLMLPVDSSLDPSQAYFSGVVSAVIPFAVYFSNVRREIVVVVVFLVVVPVCVMVVISLTLITTHSFLCF